MLFWHSFVSLTRGIDSPTLNFHFSLYTQTTWISNLLFRAPQFSTSSKLFTKLAFSTRFPRSKTTGLRYVFVLMFFSEFMLSYPTCMWPLNKGLTLKRKWSDRRTAFMLRKSAMFTSFRIPCVFHFRARKLYCTISCVLFSLHRRGSKWIVISVQNPLLWKAKTQT